MRCRFRRRPGAGVGFLPALAEFSSTGDFEGQHDAGHFAAGGDFGQGLERLAGVGGDAAFDGVPAGVVQWAFPQGLKPGRFLWRQCTG